MAYNARGRDHGAAWGRGGIGRHRRLKIFCGNACGFESRRPYQLTKGAVTEVKLQPLFHTQNQGIAFGLLVCRFAPDDAATTPHPDIHDGG